MILLDTNLLTRMTRSHEAQVGTARTAIQTLRGRGERLIVVPQNLYEFWAVATRPMGAPPAGANGLGMTPSQAGHWLRFFRRRFALLPDREQLNELWQALVEAHAITGFRAHDVRLVAAMQSYGIDRQNERGLESINGGLPNGLMLLWPGNPPSPALPAEGREPD